MLATAIINHVNRQRDNGTYPGGHSDRRLAMLQSLALYTEDDDLAEILDTLAAKCLHENEGTFHEDWATTCMIALAERRDNDTDAWVGTDLRRDYDDAINGLRAIIHTEKE